MKNKKTATIAFGGIIIIVALVCVVVNVTKGKNNDNNTTFSSEVAASEENSSGEATDEQTEVVDNTTATDDSNSDAALKFYNIGDRILGKCNLISLIKNIRILFFHKRKQALNTLRNTVLLLINTCTKTYNILFLSKSFIVNFAKNDVDDLRYKFCI